MPRDFYAVLAVPRNATTQQIRERFRELARERHPDRFRGAEKQKAESEFQSLTEAFNVLTHPERRRRHDLELARPATPVADQQAEVSQVYLRRGVKAYKEQKFYEAAENFDRATREEAGNAQAWYYLALACARQRRLLPRATKAVAKACELEPMNPTYLELAGRLFARSGLAVKAIDYFREALNWGGDEGEIQRALEELNREAKKGSGGFFGKPG